MKKATILLVILAILFSFLPVKTNAQGLLLYYDGGVLEYTGDFYTIFVQGQQLACDVPPVVIDNRTLVPIRALTEKLGATVDYYSATKTAIVRLNGFVFEFYLNTSKVIVNGVETTLDVPAKVYNNRTMVPLRFIAEYMNMDVGWFQSTLRITVDYTKLGSVTFVQSSAYNDVVINVPKYRNFSDFTLMSPDRAVVDIPNVTVNLSTSSLSIGVGSIIRVRWSQNTPTDARIVVDFTKPTSYTVIQESGKLILRFAKDTNVTPTPTPTIAPTASPTAPATQTVDTNIRYSKQTDKSEFIFSNYYPSIPADGSFNDVFTVQVDPDGNDAVYFFLGKLISDSFVPFTTTSDDIVSSLNASYISLNGKTRLEIATPRTCVFTVNYDASAHTMTITITPGINIVPDPVTIVPSVVSNSSFTYNGNIGNEEVFVYVPGYDTYEAYRTDSRTIVLNINRAYAQAGEISIPISGKYITGIKYSQVGTQTVRVTLTLNADVKDSTISRSNGIALQIFDPALYSASYYNVGDRYALILGGAILTRFTSPDFLKYYTESYSSDGLTYTVSYLTSNGDVGTGHISVNDIMVNDIDITKDGAYTKIIFHSKKRYKYNIFTKYNVNSGIVDSTSITVLNPAAPGEKLIVIDAGHGGYDPGAANDGSTEKYFNLDLALRLNALLKANGIKTYMIRSEDIDVNLRERVYIANQLNCAFYYCIHNNSALALATGTETLYYSQDAKGFSIATTIEDELIATLNTTRRNVVSRDDLFVLNSTDAPAALSEILFMSNPDDLALLRDPDFRQRAAEAMYRGLVKSMGMF